MIRTMSDDNVKDVVCGKQIRRDDGLTATYGDRPYAFCSDVCRQAFIDAPLHFVDRSGAASSTEGDPVILPSGKEVPNKV